jgi:outer membrane protein OmpA-like peptidoglycan-associated protein
VSFELGYDFHKPSEQPKNKSKGRGRQKQKRTFKDYGHCQLSAFVDVGVMNYTPDNMPQFCDISDEANIRLASTSEAEPFAPARMIPIYAGLKFAILCDLPGKKPKKEAEHKPSIVTFVSDELTGKHIAGATVTTQAAQSKKKPVVKTTDSKQGRVTKPYAPGNYMISATHPDYIPKDPVAITHEDKDDTVRIALYPRRPLRSQVVDAKTGRPVTAYVVVLSEDGDTIVRTTLDSATQVLSTLVDDRRNYTVCATAKDYRDTCVSVKNLEDVQLVQLEPIKVWRFVLKNLYFATDKTNILPSSEASLQELFQLLNDNPDIRIRIIGHTDDVGKDDYNQRLSEGRAKSVKQEMVKRGIDPTRMETTGRGENDPIVPNDSDEHRQMNRRVEIEILNGAGV